jgi:hypothetical protein
VSQIQYAEIILPDNIYDEIRLLQKKLSHKDNKVWSFSNTVNLLLRYSLCEENGLIYTQYQFLREYLCERGSFLEDFTTGICRSACLDYEYMQSFN